MDEHRDGEHVTPYVVKVGEKRRRASRAGQPKKFECPHPGCDKKYSRAEHLHRHELNHNPKEVYHCDAPGCHHSFVRQDLFVRHKHRHEELAAGAQRDFDQPPSEGQVDDGLSGRGNEATLSTAPTDVPSRVGAWKESNPSDTHVPASVEMSHSLANWRMHSRTPLLTPDSTALNSEQPPSAGLSGTLAPAIQSPQMSRTMNVWKTADDSAQANDNFAAWLFESPGSQQNEFDLNNMSFLDFGLEYSPKDMWNLDDWALSVEPATSVASHPTPGSTKDPAVQEPLSPIGISEQRREDVISLLQHFLSKQRSQRQYATEDQSRLLYSPDSHTLPNLSVGMLDKFTANYWNNVDQQMSIVHQPSFSANRCNVLLLLAIIMLGAADLVKRKPRGYLDDHKELAETIAIQLRWEIFTDPDAQPPVQLWVAQALLLLEYYEKQWSSRRLHERAHIHHASTLTLLRRGSPLVGRSDSESPTSGMPTRAATPAVDEPFSKQSVTPLDSWWMHWVRNESFNRVVFTAFQMDTLHAVMYGHAADMAPYEIRLPLPCDESLWRATNAEEVHRLDANLKMYGIKPIHFLDGLKRCLHAHDVQTHAPARMLLMAGLLSVGWHISRREKHLQFLETVPSMREQGRWRSLLLQAFGHWRQSFDDAVGMRRSGGRNDKNTDATAPTVLFHLAHMTMHADIIDIQIFSGTKRLLGRRVSDKDYVNVVHRMKSWACTPVARHAVLHAFKLLFAALLSRPAKTATNDIQNHQPTIVYNCRYDSMFYRPWAIYIASLIIWAYQRASSMHFSGTFTQQHLIEGQDERELCCRYLSACAAMEDPARILAMLSVSGCAAILSVVAKEFANGEPELLQEASKRLQSCRDMLITNTAGRLTT